MHSPEIIQALNAIQAKYGVIQYYGSSPDEEHGAAFRIENIFAVFSIHTQGGILQNMYDLQVESIPPGDYTYTDVVNFSDLIELVSIFEKPVEQWPCSSC